jgi:uncharacterized protein YcnI
MKAFAHSLRRVLISTAFALACASLTLAHIRIAPIESAPGAREKYTMRAPNEKQVATIRVEGEFPTGLQIYDFEFKPGWKIDFKKDDSGKIVGATWIGKIVPAGLAPPACDPRGRSTTEFQN